ncbi:MAG TPA: glycoside hydrolase family 15 protein [Acidimicrobiales bacterium]|jgi:GH15 family glucan-1,4-alpha-glucosidase
MIPSPRIDGYAPIEEYAVLTDGRTCALISLDGRIDWWPVPTLDSLPVCAALLDAESGGFLSLSPISPSVVERRYVAGTNVLESVFTTVDGSVRVTSALNMASSGRLPWTELALRVEGISGDVTMEWVLSPHTHFETPCVSTIEQGIPVVRCGTHTIAALFDGESDIEVAPEKVSATFTLKPGEKAVLAFIASDGEPIFVPTLTEIDGRVDATKENWSRWSAKISPTHQWSDAVVRSALVLKSLLAEYTGAIAAAATTSLPERIGGPKNWDYRFAWVRDSSFAINALVNLELSEEVHNAVAWLLRAIGRNGPDLHVFYTLAGEIPAGEEKLDLAGYRGSQPVRSGNRAAHQRQLGNYGDVFDAVYRYVKEGNVLDVTSQELLSELAQRCCNEWRNPDSGIWELPTTEHYTISKIGCWVALDRAVKLHEMNQVRDGEVARWRRERDAVREYIERECWSEEKKSYTFYAGTDDLDASVLLSARTGFDVGTRLASTIEAISRELRDGPLVYRYTGAREGEGAFVACTFWLVQALAGSGQREEAIRLMDEAVGLTNDVGILAEQIDPQTRAFLGNVPQALSHLALISAARSIDASEQA